MPRTDSTRAFQTKSGCGQPSARSDPFVNLYERARPKPVESRVDGIPGCRANLIANVRAANFNELLFFGNGDQILQVSLLPLASVLGELPILHGTSGSVTWLGNSCLQAWCQPQEQVGR